MRSVRESWRWRVLRLRAQVDRDLLAHGGRPTAASHAAFEELVTIYHAEKSFVGNVLFKGRRD